MSLSFAGEAEADAFRASFTLVDLLRLRAEDRPEKTAYVFLEDGEREGPRLTYGGIDRRARAIAAHLEALRLTGARVLLLYPPGLSYIEAFFGCLYASVTAVPAYPPSGRHLQRLISIVADAAPSAILTIAPLRDKYGPDGDECFEIACPWIATDEIDAADAAAWREIAPCADQIAFLQYTSGSTGDPRGVMVTHANLMSNEALIAESFAHDERSDLVGWLPLYHDMGLIGNILQPLYVGATAYLMSPMAFLEKPSRWLKAISDYRAHTSGGPNFAYDLCVRKIAEADKSAFDLSAWKIAFSGAEPVRAATLERFARAFAPCGFRREAFFPCYGLAEATLVATAPDRGDNLPIVQADRSALESNQFRESSNEDRQALVGCGHLWPGAEVKIVDPDSATLRPEGEVGEIWISGPGVALGYWNRPDATQSTFQATIAGGDGARYLRTGDLGFLHEGQLFVAGRLKDLVIVAGRNFHPHDIESLIEDRIEGLRAGCIGAFSIPLDDTEALVIAAEPDRTLLKRLEKGQEQDLLRRIRDAVVDALDIEAREILLVKPGSTPKTSSGKIRRAEFRRAYLAGEIDTIARLHTLPEPASVSATPSDRIDKRLMRQAFAIMTTPQRESLLTQFLNSTLARLLSCATDFDPETPISRVGLSSLRTVELKHAIDEALGLDTPIALLLSDTPLAALARDLANRVSRDPNMESANSLEVSESDLPYCQQAMWTIHRLDHASDAYNLHLAISLSERLDFPRAKNALAILFERHDQLRALYSLDTSGPSRTIVSIDRLTDWLQEEDAENWTTDELQTALTLEARRPFCLETDAPLRATLFRTPDGGSTLLLVAHHIAVDLWSMAILLDEFDAAYRSTGEAARLLPPNATYRDIVQHEKLYLSSPDAETDWLYWREQLAEAPTALDLPTDFLHTSTPDFSGASTPLRIDKETTMRLNDLARQESASLFSLLLSAYFLLLRRLTGQSDLVVGVPTSGRLSAQSTTIVGNCVNPVPIRLSVARDDNFEQVIRRTRQTMTAALEHQRFPFPLIVERLQPERSDDRWPIYQTCFVLQQTRSDLSATSAAIALGEESEAFAFCGATATPKKLESRIGIFDLEVMGAETNGELLLSFRYRTRAFAPETIAQIVDAYRRLLMLAVDAPQARVDRHSLLDAVQRRRLLVEWNDTFVPAPHHECVHQLVEERATATPDMIAIEFEHTSTTYRQLDSFARRLARRLIAEGVRPDSVVGLCAERSIELIVAILAISKAGGAYLPLDPDNPTERIHFMIEDAAPTLILAQRRFAPLAPRDSRLLLLDDACDPHLDDDDTPIDVKTRGENLAYVIYTSGSTGRPKGVAAQHRGLVNRIDWMQRRYRLRSDDAVLHKTPFGFDVSVWELLWPLAAGARLVILNPQDHRDPLAIVEEIRAHDVTTLHFVPTMLNAFMSVVDLASLPTLRRVICSGEELPQSTVTHFLAASRSELHNLYGPTEASIDVSAFHCDAADRPARVPIGRPISNTSLYILDEEMELVPVGARGELHIGGVGLARGYVGRPDLTAERFVPHPFSVGERLYRTGDLARRRPDGEIEFLGRQDHQVKIRGFRIELGEIEAALSRLPTIRDAIVLASDAPTGGKRLVAYVVADGAFDIEETRAALARTLPEHMLPQFVLRLDAMPTTSSGKLDRKALPAPELDASQADFVAAGDVEEEMVCAVFAEVLGRRQIGALDHFFEVGGDSIRAIQAASRLRQAGYDMTPRLLFRHPTARALARSLRAAVVGEDSGKARIAPYAPFALAELEAAELARLTTEFEDAEDVYPLTPMQEGMLFHALSNMGSGLYHMQERYEIKGSLDRDAFMGAWRATTSRHTILRTSFHAGIGRRPHQIVHRHADLSVDFEDIRHLSDEQQMAHIDEMLAQQRAHGFDLEKAPLMRIGLFRLADDRHICVRSFHHIILDDWCTSPLLLDVRGLYEASLGHSTPPLAPVGRFCDYIAWLSTKSMGGAETFWRSYLDGFSQPTPLVGAKAPAADAASEVDDVIVDLSPASYERLKSAAQRNHLTINTYVQAAVALVLAQAAAVPEVVFGVTVAGRPIDLPGAESTLGLFINSLPLRVRIRPGQRVVDWLRQLLAANLEIRQYEFVSQSTIQSWSDVPRSDALLFQHLLTFENAPIDPSLRGNKRLLDIDLLRLRVHTNYPLTFVAIPGSELTLRLTYDRERFERATVETFSARLVRALEQLCAREHGFVGEIELLDAGEREQSLIAWNRTDHDYGEPRDFVARFERQATLTPNAIAVTCRGESLSYRELDTRADREALALAREGVGPDVIVAVLDERSVDFLVMILAIFKAGGAYLPLDPAHPDARIRQALEESRATRLVVGASLDSRARELTKDIPAPPMLLPLRALCAEGATGRVPQRRHSPENLAFVIYTSGSTGKPKGAMVEHRGMFNNLITKVPALGLTATDVIAQTASQCFDISVWQFLTALAIGARVEIFPDDISRDPQRLAEQIAERGVTVLEAVPSMIRALLDSFETRAPLDGLRWLLPCGEAFAPELCRRFMERHPSIRLLNAYGPAECSDDVSYHPIREAPRGDDPSVPIGLPVDNTRLYLLDRHLGPAAVGVASEICVGGVQVGRGYLNRPDLTAAAFVPDPFGPAGARLYRTGDLGRRRSDGVIDFLGRSDHQVKIRGHRVEPAEVEAHLCAHPLVRAGAVIARPVAGGAYRLIAYVVPSSCAREAETLRRSLRDALPDYMIPSSFVGLDSLPVTANGKLDRKALPEPDPSALSRQSFVAPRNETEEIVASIWLESLRVEKVGVHDNFFELGGHSLLATRIAARIRAVFSVELPLRAIFESDTVEKTAELVLMAKMARRDLTDMDATQLDYEDIEL